jgi:hypothetical protein
MDTIEWEALELLRDLAAVPVDPATGVDSRFREASRPCP